MSCQKQVFDIFGTHVNSKGGLYIPVAYRGCRLEFAACEFALMILMIPGEDRKRSLINIPKRLIDDYITRDRSGCSVLFKKRNNNWEALLYKKKAG